MLVPSIEGQACVPWMSCASPLLGLIALGSVGEPSVESTRTHANKMEGTLVGQA